MPSLLDISNLRRINRILIILILGSVNEAGVLTLRGRQEGNRGRARRTTTTTSTMSPTSGTSTSSRNALVATTLTSIAVRDAVHPAALLASADPETWPFSSSPSSTPPSSNYPSLMRLSPSQDPPIEIVVKPQSKVVLPCELEGNHTRVLRQPLSRFILNLQFIFILVFDTLCSLI